MKWVYRLIWWRHPEVKKDQRQRDEMVKTVARRAREAISGADRLAEQTRAMQTELRK